jgi:hypothetical protein
MALGISMSSSFHASTVDWLGCWIATGQVKPGETIKVEADLGEQLGVSRTVIREAIKPVPKPARSRAGSAPVCCQYGAGTCSIRKS